MIALRYRYEANNKKAVKLLMAEFSTMKGLTNELGVSKEVVDNWYYSGRGVSQKGLNIISKHPTLSKKFTTVQLRPDIVLEVIYKQLRVKAASELYDYVVNNRHIYKKPPRTTLVRTTGYLDINQWKTRGLSYNAAKAISQHPTLGELFTLDRLRPDANNVHGYLVENSLLVKCKCNIVLNKAS